MKDKLTLEDLAPYFSHKLKGVLTFDQSEDFEGADWVDDYSIFETGAIWTLCGYADAELRIPLGEGDFDGFLWRNGNTHCCFHNGIKPVFYPLSYLTKEIEHNGERFVPVDILYRIGCEGQRNPFNPVRCYNGRFKYNVLDESGVKLYQILPVDDDRYEPLEIALDPEGGINFYRGLTNGDLMIYACVEQQMLFKKLYEWNFDVNGLIDRGLAIDINNLKS